MPDVDIRKTVTSLVAKRYSQVVLKLKLITYRLFEQKYLRSILIR